MNWNALALALVASTSSAVVSENEVALARALDVVQADHVRADLRFVASDELAGRDTPSQGLRLAARFIRARLQRLGFEPAGHDGGFFHLYRMERTGLDDEATGAKILGAGDPQELVFGHDYFFFPNGVGDLEVEAEVAFAGTGSAAELEGVDLAGRWAFAFDSEELSWRERRDNVQATGALGLIVASPLDGEDENGPERAAGIASWVARGSLRVLAGGGGGDVPEEDVWPMNFVSHATAKALLAKTGSKPAVGENLGVRVRDVRRVKRDEEPIVLENVAGLWPGSDPDLRNEVVVVSAHYDHMGVDGEEIYNGADDNGSGTCGLLSVAEALVEYGPMKRSVLLLWVSGEEKGLKGSYAWTQDPVLPDGARAVCNVNIDMIGRNAPDYLLVTPSVDHPAYNGLTRVAERLAPLEGFPELGSCDDYWGRSDHMNFSKELDIPVAFLFSDVHEDYHEPSDTPDKIDYDKIRRVSRLVLRMLDALQDGPLNPQ